MTIQIIIYNLLRDILENGFKKQKQYIRDKLFTQELRGEKILDLGCGTGTYAQLFDEHSYIGLEINQDYIKYAKQCKEGNFVLGNACCLPFKNGAFGSVCSIAVFHHLPEAQILDILKEVKRVIGYSRLFLLMDQVDIRVNFLIDWLFRLIRYFDKGKFIRTPQDNLNILAKEPDFDIIDSWTFRNCLITYQGILLRRK